jgi:hypothetical protein
LLSGDELAEELAELSEELLELAEKEHPADSTTATISNHTPDDGHGPIALIVDLSPLRLRLEDSWVI